VWALTELVVDGARRAETVSPVSLEQDNPWIPR